jgi:cytochrome c553
LKCESVIINGFFLSGRAANYSVFFRISWPPFQCRINYPAIMKKIFALLVLASVAQVSAAADAQGDASAAKNKVAMCIGCHGIPGYKATYPEVYRVPMLGGQSEKYIVAALNAYKKGERSHPSMVGIAKGLSDQDIADVAAYYAQQK